MNNAILVALIGLIMVVGVHVAVIARWSGRIDGYLQAAAENFKRIDAEILSLRQSRHDHEGRLQRSESVLKHYERRHVEHEIEE